ncbi:DUF6923 family protein [Flagellimonas nanhaiensis]|uniref:T9SS C-terminal target domain-containing protein n=1 Tax=Flagellimonas nanhaiensis TaxID=2292706 RepID=A0A371JTS3_9FLAO|nr:T9SS type A sorting domain-containing protein [Allomuricauda nanhaiensis]RDY61211.1 T9SS C-terminal target domain-containing protein [Allomuricauda nanhaiensis]
MKHFYHLITILTAFLIVGTHPSAGILHAQSEPFDCTYNAYLFQYNDIYAIDLASGSSYLVKEDILSSSINGAAYNSADGFLWGYVSGNPKTIVRIGKNFETDVYTIPEIPVTNNNYVGDIDLFGQYYFRSGNSTYHHVDLNPESPNYLQYMGSTTLSKSINIHDWAFNAADNMLYTVEKKTNVLYRIEVETGNVESLGVVPILSGNNYTYGAVYFDVDGNFYVSANQTGTVYVIRAVQNIVSGEMNSNVFAFGPASASNDGARCPSAPVPQEDCINGLDDDGDGLVDCDDPSCSGVASCPVIELTSSGNDGGLESNDRLGNLISKRNYKRAKDNYKFDALSAKRVKKTSNYLRKGAYSPSAIELNALVPLGIIGESSTIESAPEDLLNLTNASDIYAVDYLNGTETMSALMIIKTEEQVYEHSKFICDRFLGAQLLSVSTLQLREKDFIRSIIKQADGTKEFALSFSARLNEQNGFVVESHWNIDAYSPNTSYYNFQIWSNSVDNLLKLADEILNLLEASAPIVDYKTSTPPPVFVKSAKYERGAVYMNVVNNNKTEYIRLEGGLKRSETSDSQFVGLESVIDGYIDSVKVETGNIFDFGFRISNENGDTPDDLFVADAPWGLDDSQAGTQITQYEVLASDETYYGDGYPIERNISLKATTDSYVGVYRALSPRFAAVNLSDYNNLVFTASGTGTLEIQLIKGDGSFYTHEVAINEESEIFYLDHELFRNSDGASTDFSNLKVIQFNLKASGIAEQKAMELSSVEFTNTSKPAKFIDQNLNRSVVSPNPVTTTTSLYFYDEMGGEFTFQLFDINGRAIGSHAITGNVQMGQNSIQIDRKGLDAGLYLYRLESSSKRIWSGRILMK